MIDLKQRKNTSIFNMIDIFMQYIRAAFIKDENKETVLIKLVNYGVLIFGEKICLWMTMKRRFPMKLFENWVTNLELTLNIQLYIAHGLKVLNDCNHATIALMLIRRIS